MRILSQSFFALFVGSSTLLLAKEVAYDADLFNKDKKVFFANAEFLYWLANESALDYAIKMQSSPATPNTSAVGKYQSAAFHWEPGVRASFGYFNAPNFWDAFIQYTYVRPEGHTQVSAPDTAGQYLNGTWTQPDVSTSSSATPLSKAESFIRLNYNAFDFLFSRRFLPNPHLRMNPFGGLTTAFLHQVFSIHYQDLESRTSIARNRWRFDGLGLRLGLKVDWYLGADLYLTGQGSFGILSGWYKNTARQKTSLSPRPIHNTLYEDHRLSTTGQMLLGLSWQKRFDTVRIDFCTGYELNVWTNLHETYRSLLSPPTAAKETLINDSQVSLQGLTVKLGIDF